MDEGKETEFRDPDPAFDYEDEETLAAIERGIKSADQGRVVSLKEARQRMHQVAKKA